MYPPERHLLKETRQERADFGKFLREALLPVEEELKKHGLSQTDAWLLRKDAFDVIYQGFYEGLIKRAGFLEGWLDYAARWHDVK